MDNFFHTVIFTSVAGFFQSLWAEINGRIFLTTFIAYGISYMVYSGYVSWFAGGYGGILLTQMGFSVIDLLGLLPMAFLLFADSLWPLVKTLGKFILLYMVLPFALLWATINLISILNVQVFPGDNAIPARIGILFWAFGSMVHVLMKQKKKEYHWVTWILLGLCYLGAILAGLTIPFVLVAPPGTTIVTPSQTIDDPILKIIFESVTAVLIFVVLPMIPLAIGRSLGAYAAKENLLSRIQKLVLKQPMELPGAVLKKVKKKKAFIEGGNMVSYHWEKDQPMYLVASLSRTTALYAPSETTGTQKGRLLLVANDIICSMEID